MAAAARMCSGRGVRSVEAPVSRLVLLFNEIILEKALFV